jgi:hypothetical protein
LIILCFSVPLSQNFKLNNDKKTIYSQSNLVLNEICKFIQKSYSLLNGNLVDYLSNFFKIQLKLPNEAINSFFVHLKDDKLSINKIFLEIILFLRNKN